VLLGIRPGHFRFRLQDFHLLWCSFQLLRLTFMFPDGRPTTPSAEADGLGFSLFARRY
jgi:hypothetical protein